MTRRILALALALVLAAVTLGACGQGVIDPGPDSEWVYEECFDASDPTCLPASELGIEPPDDGTRSSQLSRRYRRRRRPKRR